MADKQKKGEKKDNWFKRHKILTGIFAVVGLLIFIGIVSPPSEENKMSQQPQEQQAQSAPQQVAGTGQPARDGKFEFTVSGVTCGQTRVGNEYFGEDAQGEFCMVNMTIKNIGNESQSLFADNQYAYDATNKRYSADSGASIYASSNGSTWYDQINPGNSVSGAVIFDVPKGTKLVTAELHDSALSGGVKVNLQ